MKQWFLCPVCRQKLCMINQKAQGVFLQCKRCKQEVEIRYKENSEQNKSEPEPEP